MKYRKIEKEFYNIYLIPNKNLHNVFISVNLTSKCSKEKATCYNVLADLLTYATSKYDTTTKLLKESHRIYAMNPKVAVSRFGNYIRFKLMISVLDSIYISKDHLLDAIKLLNEVLNKPLIENKIFPDKYFNIVMKDLKNEVLSSEENTRLYANLLLLKHLDPENPNANYKITGLSSMDVLQSVTKEKLYEYYTDLINNSKIDFYIAGDLKNEDDIVDTIVNTFKMKSNLLKLDDPYIYHKKKNMEIKAYHETRHCSQSKLSIACKVYETKDNHNHFVISIFNYLFGAGSSGFLMKYVREKNNLCYYISSYCYKMDNLIIINSGINKENYDKTIELIKYVLKKIQDGKFTNKELNSAKEEFLAELDALNDGNGNLSEYVYGIENFHSKTIDERKKEVKNITKEDIKTLASKVFLDTIVFLEGDL